MTNTLSSLLDPIILFLMILVVVVTVGILAVEIKYLE